MLCKTTTKSEISKEPGERHLFARRYLQLTLFNPGHFDFEFFEGSDWLRINDREYADRKNTRIASKVDMLDKPF